MLKQTHVCYDANMDNQTVNVDRKIELFNSERTCVLRCLILNAISDTLFLN